MPDYTKLELDAAWHSFIADKRQQMAELRLRAPNIYDLAKAAFESGYSAGKGGALSEQIKATEDLQARLNQE